VGDLVRRRTVRRRARRALAWQRLAARRSDATVPYDTLVAWGDAVIGEHSMIGDLSMAFRVVDRHALENAPIEIVVEWNA